MKLKKTYDAKVDSKKRITLRDTEYEYYHVKEYENGCIILEPRELVSPFTISKETQKMMDNSIKNFKKKKVSPAIDLSDFED